MESNGIQKALNAGRAAYNLARIAKGFMMGGIKGALLETAKAFSPTIIKVTIGIIVALIFLPYLIIAAVPNIMFQYSSNNASDIVTMSEKAKVIEEAYKITTDYKKSQVDSIVKQLSDGYDEIVISEDGASVNDYWFIAITSVAYKQDLFSMNEEDVKKGIIESMVFDWFQEDFEKEDGETITTLKRLNISVKELNPEELMNQLAFTDEQKNWALLLYRTMSDDQTIRPGDPNYIEGNLADYGDIKYKQGETDVVYYNQGDARWGSKLYGQYDTIKACGCGPTSLAMVVSSFTDTMIDPKQMADWSSANGYCVKNSGSKHALIPDGAKHFGLQVDYATRYEGQKIVNALSEGKLVIAIMGPGHFTTGGHFMVLRGVTSEGKILVADPASYRNTGMEWDLSIILNESRWGAGAGSPFWIISL